jgi:hypothetical protein
VPGTLREGRELQANRGPRGIQPVPGTLLGVRGSLKVPGTLLGGRKLQANQGP